jgi:Arc/MetJ-type ribon-helix-helix transcriptional regulator
MNLELPPDSAEFVADQVRRGGFSSPEDVVVAALETFRADCQFGDFTPDELNRLLEEGERSAAERGWYAGDDARRELAARLERIRASKP